MKTIVRSIADSLVEAVAPHADATAQYCYWSSYCFCRSGSLYYKYCCQGVTCYCRAKSHAPGGCA